MISEKTKDQVKVVESNLHVAQTGERTVLEFRLPGSPMTQAISMPTGVWREFCRRQIAVPPPLPKGGQS